VKVLFVCIHNSARSQIAEAFLKQLAPSNWYIESAGIKKGNLNPLVVDILKEKGFDLSQKKTQTIEEVLKKNITFNTVITVCDAENANRCPRFPKKTKKINWFFEDIKALKGDDKEKKEKISLICDEIEKKIKKWLLETSNIS